MKDWYSRQEVAEILGISLSTVYQYAKQKKIIKLNNPHYATRGARYRKEEVDSLARERELNRPKGTRPSTLAKKLNIPVNRVYSIIREFNLPVEEYARGDELKGYSLSDDTVQFITETIHKTLPERGTRAEFYDPKHDIALYQKFHYKSGHPLRVIRNNNMEWGFYIHTNKWLSYEDAVRLHELTPAYSIHKNVKRIVGYTDFILPKDLVESYDFLDFVYQVWGIENIRLREKENQLHLSIKSGVTTVNIECPPSLDSVILKSFVVAGDIEITDTKWNMISSTKNTSIQLSNDVLKKLYSESKKNNITISEYIEQALITKFNNKKD